MLGFEHITGVKPPATHDLARLLLLLEKAGVDITALLSLRAFSTFAVQCRYDDEPEELSLDRGAWCNRAEALIEQVQMLLNGSAGIDTSCGFAPQPREPH